jgi:Ca-activated chloride channel family protein
MTTRLTDEQLTAFALGELESPLREQAQALVEQDAEARKLVDEIRATAAELSRQLKQGQPTGLDEPRRRLVLQPPTPGRAYRAWFIGAGLAAAACATVAVAIWQTLGTVHMDRIRSQTPQEQIFEHPVALATPPPVVTTPAQVRADRDFHTEAYDAITDNAFLTVAQNPLSTFSIDVDTASYANVRRFITQQKQLPPAGAVRIEELINYFPYTYSLPADEHPVAIHTELAACPWQPEHQLLKVGLKARAITRDQTEGVNLVFLLDVSGSMNQPNKLPLVRESMKLLVRELSPRDRVAIVVYAGSSGLVLDSTSATEKDKIVAAIDSLTPGGSTNGAAGIQLAYEMASKHFITGGVNRVILATDGDFNVGVTSQDELTRLIEAKRKSGVFLSVLGFGMGNLKDSTMEKLADKGNGNYGYIDTLDEARKVLVEQMGGTLFTVAKDVKLQLEFNPARVASYRLIGYENRMLAKEDFNDDRKDAGEIGSGHTVTALYELVPAPGSSQNPEIPSVDPLKYQTPPAPANLNLISELTSTEWLTVKLRYKQPEGETSVKLEHPVAAPADARQTSDDFRFAAAVAQFGMILRNSPHKGQATIADTLDLAAGALGNDEFGYRRGFVQLVEQTRAIAPQ